MTALALFVGAILLFALAGRTLARTIREYRQYSRHETHGGLTEDEARAHIAPYTEPIAVWPSRAPRNGSAYEDVS